MADIACGGWVRLAATSRASVRGWAASSATISSPTGLAPSRIAANASATGIRAKRYSSNPERAERARHIVGRFDVNGGKAICPRARDIVGGVIEKHNAGSGRADRADDVMIGGSLRLAQP